MSANVEVCPHAANSPAFKTIVGVGSARSIRMRLTSPSPDVLGEGVGG